MGAAHVDVVVVGSGFGGSVVAQRLAEAGRRVLVLERGRAYPPGTFARTPRELAQAFWDPSAGMHGLFQVHSFSGLDAVVSAGLGGGSLIYANVLIRKDERWFVHDQPLPDGSGVEHWPVSRGDLEPHYARVERMLGATAYPWADTTPKTTAMREVADRLGLEWHLPHLAVSFAAADGTPVQNAPLPEAPYGNLHGLPRRTCRLCGECDIGCNDGAKNTLDHTYLSAAVHEGAEVRTRCEVRRIAPLEGGGYQVDFVPWGEEHDGAPTDANEVEHDTLTCDRLVLGAGALGTPSLLLRNVTNLTALGPALGTRFCGNGDLLGLAMRARRKGAPWVLDPSRGPVITSTIRVPDEVDGAPAGARGFYLQDAGFPGFVAWIVESVMTPSDLGRAAWFALDRIADRLTDDADSDLSQEFSHLLGDGVTSSSSMPLLGMGRDVPDGTLRLREGQLDVDWTTDTSMTFFERVRDTMRDVAGELGAEFRDNLLWAFKRVITVHPLGGAPMGRRIEEGVVDAWGEAFGHPGLHVVDGAALPGPVGPNPSLTIAAFADRAAERILEADERLVPRVRETGASAPTTVPARVPSTTGTSLSFTEEMKGYVGLGEIDFARGAERGRSDGTALMFRLTITMEDVEGFVADPDHPGAATGWVQCDAVGGRREVERGWFNLFVDTDVPDTTRMLYRLWFDDAVGNPLTLTGFKVVHDDPGLDTWADTSTLYVHLVQGHVEPTGDADATVVASGVITIHLVDFLQQLTTFRARGGTVGDRGAAMAAFGRLFLGELWDTYGGRAVASLQVGDAP